MPQFCLYFSVQFNGKTTGSCSLLSFLKDKLQQLVIVQQVQR